MQTPSLLTQHGDDLNLIRSTNPAGQEPVQASPPLDESTGNGTAMPGTPADSDGAAKVFEQRGDPVARTTRTIAFALDGSKCSDHGQSAEVFRGTDSLIILHSRPSGPTPGMADLMADLSSTYATLERSRAHSSHTLLRSYASLLPPTTYRVKCVSLRGDPRDAVRSCLESGEGSRVDMLVVGARGKGGVLSGKDGVGSVASYLVRNARCAVVVVKGEGQWEKGEKEAEMAKEERMTEEKGRADVEPVKTKAVADVGGEFDASGNLRASEGLGVRMAEDRVAGSMM
ncbi:hypothetical protein HK101_002938 [Irineochytrium annulatum]|nr:hypothetical protein HK101_002938 [Irineochytrium annulatum]